MGKATRWFRGLLGLTRPGPTQSSNPNPNPNQNPTPKPPKDKRRWSFVKSYREKSSSSSSASRRRPHSYDATTATAAAADDANKHAIAVAAATAAVAEAAVAAAQAAAAVVRLTHGGPRVSGGCRGGERQLWAVVVIQSRFRGYLARRALRALKGLVKLQALVRGHIMRRKTAETMRCMQAMLRAQARARSVRAYIPESPLSSSKSCQLHQPGPPTPEKIEQFVRATSGKHDHSPKIKRNGSRSSSRTNTSNQDRGNFGSSWSDPRMDDPAYDPRATSSTRTCKTDEDRADRILEIDTGRPPVLRRRNLFEYPHSGPQPSDHITTSKDSTARYTVPSPSASCEVVQSLNPLKFLEDLDDGVYCTAENSPRVNSAASIGGSSRRGPFTPTKSDGSKSYLSGYSDCPSYMAYTESSKAKVRSLSAPKQRPHYDRQMGSTKRYSVHGFGEHNPRASSRMSSMQASFTSKGYPGSGRLDRLGLPVRDSTVVYYSGYLN